MLTKINYSFETERLQVKEWHLFQDEGLSSQNLLRIVKDILTPLVTESLPPDWQGHYSVDRAREWIKERDNEGVTLLIVESVSMNPLGVVILFDMNNGSNVADLRLGYFLAESAWGKGIGSELVKGLVSFCREQPVASITGGVAKENYASKRVLEKNGFICDAETENEEEQTYKLQLRPNKSN
ncbi:MAG: GNAT family N-acetyltransferase [Sedimenticola sp.]